MTKIDLDAIDLEHPKPLEMSMKILHNLDDTSYLTTGCHESIQNQIFKICQILMFYTFEVMKSGHSCPRQVSPQY